MELFPTQLRRALSSMSRCTSPGVRSTTFSIAAVTTYARTSVRRAWCSATSSASLSTTSSTSPEPHVTGQRLLHHHEPPLESDVGAEGQALLERRVDRSDHDRELPEYGALSSPRPCGASDSPPPRRPRPQPGSTPPATSW